MRRFVLFAWIMLLPVGGLYHLVAGPGLQQLDQIGNELTQARQLAAAGEWNPAVFRFEQALQELPPERITESRQIRLEMATAKINGARLPEAHGDLKQLLDELLQDEEARDAALEEQTRHALAQSQYYMTWLMKLEGRPREEWEPEIESARQNYRLLAEQAERSGDSTEASDQQENLEAAIRLARVELTDLQGLPIPKQCQGCCSCNSRSRRQGPPKKDGKQLPKDNRGATAGPPPDGVGS